MARRLSTPEKHQLAIAKKTLKMPDAMVGVMGGPTKAEARAIIKKLTGKTVKESVSVRTQMESLLRPTVGDIAKHKRSSYKLAPTDASSSPGVQTALTIVNRLDYRLSNLDKEGDAERPKRQKNLLIRDLKQLMDIVKGL